MASALHTAAAAALLASLCAGCRHEAVTPSKAQFFDRRPAAHKLDVRVDVAADGPRYQPVEVLLAVDNTGSMGGIIGQARTHTAEIISDLKQLGGEVEIGVAAYGDYAQEP